MFKILFKVFIINYVLTYLSGINSVSYKSLITYFVIILLSARFIPKYFDIKLGTGRASSIYHNLILLIMFMIGTVSIKGGIVFFSYFLVSDLLFRRKWVEYD